VGDTCLAFMILALIASFSGFAATVLCWAHAGLTRKGALCIGAFEDELDRLGEMQLLELLQLEEYQPLPLYAEELWKTYATMCVHARCIVRLEQHLDYVLWGGVATPGIVMVIMELFRQRVLDEQAFAVLFVFGGLICWAFYNMNRLEPKAS
jgi:hypothetical protein